MSWNLPTPAEEWDHYGAAELELASLEEAAGTILDPTDPEGMIHGWLEAEPARLSDEDVMHALESIYERAAELGAAMHQDYGTRSMGEAIGFLRQLDREAGRMGWSWAIYDRVMADERRVAA